MKRFNRTLKGKMWKYFTAVNTIQWRPILQDLIINYNNSHHRSIKITPVEGSKVENKSKVFWNLYGKNQRFMKPMLRPIKRLNLR